MKKLALIILAFITLSAVAQNTPVDKYLKKYDWGQGISKSDITPGKTNYPDDMKINDQAVSELMEKVDHLILVKGDSASDFKARESFYKGAYEILQDDTYANIIQVNSDDGDKVGIYTSQNKKGNLSEIVFLMLEEDNLLMMVVKGDINLSELGLGDLMKVFDTHEHKDCDKEDGHGQDRGD